MQQNPKESPKSKEPKKFRKNLSEFEKTRYNTKESEKIPKNPKTN